MSRHPCRRRLVGAVLVALLSARTLGAAPGRASVHLDGGARKGDTVSFALPLPPGAVSDVAAVRVMRGDTGRALEDVGLWALLFHLDGQGRRTAVRSLLVQFAVGDASPPSEVVVDWGATATRSTPAAVRRAPLPYTEVRVPSAETVEVVERTVERSGKGYRLVESSPVPRTVLTGWAPRVLATPAHAALAASALFGPLLTAEDVHADRSLRGVAFLSESVRAFTRSALFLDGYRPSAYPGTKSDPLSAAVVDLSTDAEAWLYDPCATFLLDYAHTGDVDALRQGLRACSFYASQIDDRGMFRLKMDSQGQGDPKYSHARGLYFYYALTGDSSALEAGRRVARMWLDDKMVVKGYREGRMPARDHLWTERLLACALEGLVYGFLLTEQPELLSVARQLVDTAAVHVTTSDAARLERLTGLPFPPQDCFVHAESQHEGGSPDKPWCSPWMSALLVDPLLRYQELTRDDRVDAIFVRLARFVRDTGSTYFWKNPLGDSFLKPTVCFDPAQVEDPRLIVPLYGAGRLPGGERSSGGEWEDFNHCADVSALTAAGLAALVRTGGAGAPGPPPFRTEGESLVALHQELLFCAQWTFGYFSRARRDPRVWTSEELAPGLGQPDFTVKNKIGFAIHAASPPRKLSWWFNASILQFALLREAGVTLRDLRPGAVRPARCPEGDSR